MSKKSQNYLIAKTGLGEVRKGFHDLPSQDHIYGKAPVKDAYGAREVIGNWKQAEKSQSKQGGKDYISMNREGLKQGFIDSKNLSEFRKNNEIKVKVKEGQKVYGVKIPDEQFTYGVPNRPSTPIKNVICNTYAIEDQNLKNQKEAVFNMLQKDSKTKSPVKLDSSKAAHHELNRKKQIEDNNFKLSKFKDVPSKIKPLIEANKSKAQTGVNANN